MTSVCALDNHAGLNRTKGKFLFFIKNYTQFKL